MKNCNKKIRVQFSANIQAQLIFVGHQGILSLAKSSFFIGMEMLYLLTWHISRMINFYFDKPVMGLWRHTEVNLYTRPSEGSRSAPHIPERGRRAPSSANDTTLIQNQELFFYFPCYTCFQNDYLIFKLKIFQFSSLIKWKNCTQENYSHALNYVRKIKIKLNLQLSISSDESYYIFQL